MKRSYQYILYGILALIGIYGIMSGKFLFLFLMIPIGFGFFRNKKDDSH
ncbi:hypothetical protein [Subsaximicrobium wynnwilliamsii]|nr:hypothetical protein [Subsaximicrobium wynnwilliamsii]